MTIKKRVWSLYRVSTTGQVYSGEDIPMQENAVKAFVNQRSNEWSLERELKELGVSGFKKKVADRDALQEIKRGAEKGQFDILVVFFSDRLGRDKFEIPLILEYLTQYNVEVWSVKEGKLNAEKHEDSLITFLRFWTAEGESRKISMRVQETMDQMRLDGKWLGGKRPYGYCLMDTGVPHPKKKERTIKDLGVDEDEAKVVRIIFDFCLNKGWGADRIGNWLNENGYKNRKNTLWSATVLRRILKNPIYAGLRYLGTSFSNDGVSYKDILEQSVPQEYLCIIPYEDWLKTQKILEERIGNGNRPKRGKLLLAGIAKCGYCGHNLYIHDASKKVNTKEKGEHYNPYYSYRCKKSATTKFLHEKRSFGSRTYEKIVEKYIKEFIDKFNKESFLEQIKVKQNQNFDEDKQIISQLKKEAQETEKQLTLFKNEVAKSILGQSSFSPEILNGLILETESKLKEQKDKLSQVENQLNEKKNDLENIDDIHHRLENWDDLYDQADLEEKRMMLSEIIESVYFKKDEVEINYKLFSLVEKYSD